MSQRAHWSCELSCLEGVALSVESVRVTERIDRPFEMELVLRVGDPDVDAAPVLGADCTVTVARPDHSRRFIGVVREVRARDDATEGEAALRLIVVPALALLSLRRDTRIFQDKSAPEVLEQVLTDGLAPYGREVRLELQGDFPKRDYLLQYGETDLGFVHRLLEESGISYAFDCEGDVERMTLRDVSSTYPDLETAEGTPTLLFEPHTHESGAAENVYSLRRALRPTIGKAASRGRDFTRARRVDAENEDPDGRTDREDFVHRRGRLLRDDAESERYVTEGLESVRARALQIRCAARAIGLAPGRQLELEGHPIPGVDERYLVTEVVHSSAPEGEGAPTDGYVARFAAIPSSVPWRPMRDTPKPMIGSVETATVVGPSGEEIHTDEHGRIKVQFHWDRQGANDEHSSCWLRVRQAWAGAGWGFVFLPRIGMEVVVGFLEGDPDRPVVLGCLYNADNPPPYPLPDDKTKSTIKSNSSPGGGGFNEWRYEDKAGEEQIFSHAQKNQDEEVLNDHTTQVGHDQTNEVQGDQKQTVGQHQTETVDVDQAMTVMQKRTVKVTGKFDETIKGAESRNVVGGVTEKIDGGEKRTVMGGLEETRIGDETRIVFGDENETSLGDLTQNVVGNVNQASLGMLSMTAVGAVNVLTPATAAYTGVGMLQMTIGGTMTILAPPSLQWQTAARTEFQGMVTSSKAFAIGITGLNITTQGTATAMSAVSIDKTKIKAEAWGATVGVHNLAVGVVGASASAVGININVGAFRMENAALDLSA